MITVIASQPLLVYASGSRLVVKRKHLDECGSAAHADAADLVVRRQILESTDAALDIDALSPIAKP